MKGRLTQTLAGMLLFALVATGAPADAQLSNAAMRGDTAQVQALLDQDVDVNEAQGDGTTALHWASYRGDAEMARLLLEAGADIDVTTRVGELTPLFMASKIGNAEIIGMLIEAGADAKATTTTGTSALMMASASGNADAVKVLIDAGADPNAKDVNQGQTAMMYAAAPGNVEVIKLLAERGADVNATSLVPTPRKAEGAGGPAWRGGKLALGGLAAIHFAARDGRIAAIDALLEMDADIDKVTASNGMSALTIAILNAQFDTAMHLLEKGADPNGADEGEGVTALYALIDAQWANRVWYPPPTPEQERVHYLDILEKILDYGVDVDVRLKAELWQRQMHGEWVKPAGATAFWRAAQANDVPAMKMLIAAGANPSIPNRDGVTPLQVASGWGYEPQTSTYIPDARLDAVRYLVEELGADVNSRDLKGYTPLHAAALTAEFGREVLEYLVSAGADVTAQADMIMGGATDPDQDVEPGTGDTVADMANGPKPHNLVHPEAVVYLEDIGSPNSYNCRASTCINAAKKDRKKPSERRR